jgi:exopolysaccharide biosynthesis WecB/TagA/CpsF family protein
VLLALAGGVLAGFSLYLLILALAYATHVSDTRSEVSTPNSSLVVLVPAHDEESLVSRCVGSLLAQSYPRSLYRVIVIADNCSDLTAARATEAGAEVMVRDQPDRRGKGHALRWAMDRLLAAPNSPDAIAVVDADSIAGTDLLRSLEKELATGHDVVQADYTVLADSASPQSQLVAAGFLLFHRVRFGGRARLGMAANLVGNGMLFSRAVLEAHPWSAFSGVEDLEYSIELRMAGIRPRFAPAAIVSGPAPATRAGDVRQRLRWEGGRFHVVRTRLAGLVGASAARRDAALLDAALDLATPPLGLLCLLAAGGSTVTGFAVLAHLAPAWAVFPWVVALVAIPSYVVIGLHAAGAPSAVWRVIPRMPFYLGWKVLTYLVLLRGFDPTRWDRSDRQPEPTGDGSRIDIAGVPIDAVDMRTAVSRLRAAIGGPRLFQASTINLDFLVRAQREDDIRRIFERSDLNLPDGAPVVWLGRILGANMPGRVAGADLVPALLSEAASSQARVFLLGGEHGVAAAAGTRLSELYPGLVIAGTYEPARASVEAMNNDEILARIAQARPDVLLVAFGHPKQERWIELHRDKLEVSVAMGVGCVFDLIAGRTQRAPRWMQDAGLEWAYRLGQEPGRLLGRYLTDAAWLIPLIAIALRHRRAGRRVVEIA